MDKKSTKGLKPKQRLRSTSFRELNLQLVSKLSYRDTTDVLNRVLHREEYDSVKTSTLEDWVESFGESLSDGYTSKAEKILESYNIDKDGLIAKDSHLPLSIIKPELSAGIEEKQIRHLITEYNRGRDRMTKLKYASSMLEIEDGTAKCCYISVDDIGVRFQKSKRKQKYKKGKSFVENTVIHIQSDGKQYTLTAVGMDKAFKLLIAFLLGIRDTFTVFYSFLKEMTICKYCSFHLNGSDDVGFPLLHGFCDIGHIALHFPVVLVTVGRVRIIRILDTVRLYFLLVPQDSLSVLHDILFVKQTFKKIIRYGGGRKSNKHLHDEIAYPCDIALKRVRV